MGSVPSLDAQYGAINVKEGKNYLAIRQAKVQHPQRKLIGQHTCKFKNCLASKQFRKELEKINYLNYNTSIQLQQSDCKDGYYKLTFSYIFQISHLGSFSDQQLILTEVIQEFHQQCTQIARALNVYLQEPYKIPIELQKQEKGQVLAVSNHKVKSTPQIKKTIQNLLCSSLSTNF